jgi:hypothetical protein
MSRRVEWGQLQERTLVRVPVAAGDRVLIPGDIHFPKHDPKAWRLMLEVAKALGVTHVFLQGDTFDYWGISKHGKSAIRHYESGQLQQEADAAEKPLAALRALVKAGNAYIGPGNHEERWYRNLVDEIPALNGLEWDTPVRSALKGWTVLPRAYWAKMGRLVVEHGHMVRGIEKGGGKFPSSKVLANYPGQNTLVGHVHRIDVRTTPTRKDGYKVSHGCWAVGHMSREDYHEAGAPPSDEHEQGFALVDFFPLGRTLGHHVEVVRILRDRKSKTATVHVHGRTWRA